MTPPLTIIRTFRNTSFKYFPQLKVGQCNRHLVYFVVLRIWHGIFHIQWEKVTLQVMAVVTNTSYEQLYTISWNKRESVLRDLIQRDGGVKILEEAEHKMKKGCPLSKPICFGLAIGIYIHAKTKSVHWCITGAPPWTILDQITKNSLQKKLPEVPRL